MASIPKNPVSQAMAVIDGELARELHIHRINLVTRSKAHLFAMGRALKVNSLNALHLGYLEAHCYGVFRN